ncbi:hypothetical protein RJ639_045231 [Escallonia herrerae]|uniref:Uncharacterized protein n=1 Tax=Escallonia herrerae TaxID=1293975 RepID=A0AA89B0A2_9ASTE|nr:hypothetical protein RJ639_045231 [Escallonia herrerae]
MLVPIFTHVLAITIGVLVIVWLEREISAGIQQRIGPEYAGHLGILQALADDTKLLFKENLLPSRGDARLFSIGPSIAVMSILLSYLVIPFGYCLVLADLSIAHDRNESHIHPRTCSSTLRASLKIRGFCDISDGLSCISNKLFNSWHDLIETLAWAHAHTPLANLIHWRDKPVALSIVQARLIGLAHFYVDYIFTYAAFLIASTSGKFG